jgi:hypothetical protein
MSRRTSTSIARKAQAKAEADFATWLMMAKLGSFDDLPPQAQTWLLSYRTRLTRMAESEATSTTICEIYVAYYAQMGGAGEAPDLVRATFPATDARAENKIVDLKQAKASRAASEVTPARSKLPLPPLLIFAGMVAALAALKFAFGS